jgi:hypothetical protein
VLGALTFVRRDLAAGAPDGGFVLVHGLIIAQRCCDFPARTIACLVSAKAAR